jgi:nicotinate (nicotinamide) nucleotide adenylyltransferase
MAKKLALFGGSFNPPHVFHRRVAEELTRHFDEVVVVPCGPRPDKSTAGEMDPLHRAAMVDMTFHSLDRVRVEFFDLERAWFTRSYDLIDRFAPEGEVWLVVGSDLIAGGRDGRSAIQSEWVRGGELWREAHFAVVTRPGSEVEAQDLPSQSLLLKARLDGSSSDIRERAFRRQPLDGLVTEKVRDYIVRYGLYRGGPPRKSTRFRLERPRLKIICDKRNEKACRIAERFAPLEATADPNLVLVAGGDGTMLHAIRSHWRLRLPFLGLNAGHRGFLLNAEGEEADDQQIFQNLILRQLPLLFVEVTHPSGEKHGSLAFNDTWIERNTGQAATLEVRVNGKICFSRFVGDGILVATAAGSTAYARAMGATPILADSQALLLVGSNVMEPPGWVSAHLSLDSTIDVSTLNLEKRPVKAYVDGVELGEVAAMKVRSSRTAAVELAFTPHHDMAEKLVHIQFPGT